MEQLLGKCRHAPAVRCRDAVVQAEHVALDVPVIAVQRERRAQQREVLLHAADALLAHQELEARQQRQLLPHRGNMFARGVQNVQLVEPRGLTLDGVDDVVVLIVDIEAVKKRQQTLLEIQLHRLRPASR